MNWHRSPKGSEKALGVDDQSEAFNVAIELFRSMGPDVDVLFSGIIMPGMSDIDQARDACSLNPHIKVVLVSGYAASARQREIAARKILNSYRNRIACRNSQTPRMAA